MDVASANKFALTISDDSDYYPDNPHCGCQQFKFLRESGLIPLVKSKGLQLERKFLAIYCFR